MSRWLVEYSEYRGRATTTGWAVHRRLGRRRIRCYSNRSPASTSNPAEPTAGHEIHAELVLGLGVEVNHKRVARLMREAGVQGLYRRRTRGGPTGPATEDDLVHRQFAVAAPDRLWLTDITEHPTNEGKLYCCAVMDAYSRRIVGWSIAHHMRTELVLDALGMAIISRRATGSEEDIATILHSDHGTQFTSMGTIGDCYDNSMMKSFWGTCNSRSSTPGLGKRGPRLPTRSSSG
jgi:transposase InsO family protein